MFDIPNSYFVQGWGEVQYIYKIIQAYDREKELTGVPTNKGMHSNVWLALISRRHFERFHRNIVNLAKHFVRISRKHKVRSNRIFESG